MTPGQLAFWLIRAGLFRTLVPKRLTVDWSERELALLEAHYCLDGMAYIQRHTGRTTDSIRRKASNLDLSSEMRVFVPLADVAKEAGVTRGKVLAWVQHHHYRHHCRTWGREILLPLPAANLYLTRRIPRRLKRPANWWGVHRTAEYLTCQPSQVHHYAQTGRLNAVSVQRTVYIDPHSAHELKATHAAQRPRPNELRVRDLATAAGLHAHRDTKTLHKVPRLPPGTARPSHYTTEHEARAFLTARGHRDEMVETLLRKALTMQEAHKQLSESDTENTHD